MFQKPFRVKTQTCIKGSDRKKIKSEVQKTYPMLSPENVLEIVPNKKEMTVAKICTHSGENCIVYCVEKTPVLFDCDGIVYPSVYTLWKFPDILPVFRTWPPVFSKMAGGADLMLPGVIVNGELSPKTFAHINKGTICSVALAGNKSPVAVGTAAMSGSDMFESAMRGKGIHIVHILGDELWAFGDKSKPPVIPEDIENTTNDVHQSSDDIPQSSEDQVGDGSDQETVEEMNNLAISNEAQKTLDKGAGPEDHSNGVQISTDETVGSDDQGSEAQKDSEAQKSSDERGGLEEKEVANEDGACVGVSPIESMDELFKICFKCAIKMSVKPADLPLLTSAFFKLHMTKYCPSNKILDIKKSSFKKLSKFLCHMENEGFIKVREFFVGVESISEIDKSHVGLRNISPPEGNPVEDTTATVSADVYQPPQITEMLSVTAQVLSTFTDEGLKKGSVMTSGELRNIINEYVRKNNLQDANNKSQVQLDPNLASLVLNRDENNVTHLRWEELTSRISSKMQAVHKVEFPGQPAVIKKGKVEEIRIDVVQRASNKKCTTVENLDRYGIDLKTFAHEVQINMQCSCNTGQSKTNKPQVVIQGNQVSFVTDLLLKKYHIPNKFIRGWEKAPKSAKRK